MCVCVQFERERRAHLSHRPPQPKADNKSAKGTHNRLELVSAHYRPSAPIRGLLSLPSLHHDVIIPLFTENGSLIIKLFSPTAAYFLITGSEA